ncbi:MAG: tRNA (guanine(10)-N(2))-dimethyltransferase [Candidatus Hydrothermarchaeota archaeon]
MSHSLKIVREGLTEFFVPDDKGKVFFNPVMSLSRDISVLVVKSAKIKDFVDVLGATGARGLRIAKETSVDEVIINDLNRDAYNLIKQNIKHLKLKNAVAENKEANLLLSEIAFHGKKGMIDIDPFGSPVYFLENGVRAVSKRGIIGFTATDTAPLCGVYDKACFRKYNAHSLRVDYCHEVGLRILIATAMRIAGRHELSFTPIFSHSTDHYFRVYGLLRKGISLVDRIFKQIGYLNHCDCGKRELGEYKEKCGCGKKYLHAGPLWTGKLYDNDFFEEIFEKIRTTHINLKTKRLLERIKDEIEAPPLYFNVHKICKSMGISSPPMEYLIEKLREESYIATRTHFSPLAVKTDASIDKIKEILRAYNLSQ